MDPGYHNWRRRDNLAPDYFGILYEKCLSVSSRNLTLSNRFLFLAADSSA